MAMMRTRGTARHYEVLGRVMMALVGNSDGFMDGAEDFYFYETISGGFTLAWDSGPHLAEVIGYLMEIGHDPEQPILGANDVVVRPGERDLELFVCGIPIAFRVSNTIGSEAAWEKALGKLAS